MIRERRINIETDDFASLFLYGKQVFAPLYLLQKGIVMCYSVLTSNIKYFL